jgi:hypothetical protein
MLTTWGIGRLLFPSGANGRAAAFRTNLSHSGAERKSRKQEFAGEACQQEGGSGGRKAKKRSSLVVPVNSFPQICVVSGISVGIEAEWYKSTEGMWILVTPSIMPKVL